MLIIFDCDGVLVDSEGIAAEVFARELNRCGIKITADDCSNQFKGKTLPDCMDLLETRFPRSLPKDFLEQLGEATLRRFEQDLKPVEGVSELLQYLRDNNIPFCVASNGGYAKMTSSLGLTGLLRFFEGRCFSAESVRKGKPDPALFLWAAESMGVPRQFCVVIEDSESGLLAARAAGMTALKYCINGEVEDSDCVTFSRMSDLPAILSLTRRSSERS